MFSVNRLRNLLKVAPREKTPSNEGTISPTVVVPVTASEAIVVVARVEVPIIVSVPDATISPPIYELPPTF